MKDKGKEASAEEFSWWQKGRMYCVGIGQTAKSTWITVSERWTAVTRKNPSVILPIALLLLALYVWEVVPPTESFTISLWWLLPVVLFVLGALLIKFSPITAKGTLVLACLTAVILAGRSFVPEKQPIPLAQTEVPETIQTTKVRSIAKITKTDLSSETLAAEEREQKRMQRDATVIPIPVSCGASDCPNEQPTSTATTPGDDEMIPQPPRRRSKELHLPTSGDEGQIRTALEGDCVYETAGSVKCSGIAENRMTVPVTLYIGDGTGCDDDFNCSDIRVNGRQAQFTNGWNNITLPPGGKGRFTIWIKTRSGAHSMTNVTMNFFWGERKLSPTYTNIPVDQN